MSSIHQHIMDNNVVVVVVDREEDGSHTVRISTNSFTSWSNRTFLTSWETEAWWVEGEQIVHRQVFHRWDDDHDLTQWWTGCCRRRRLHPGSGVAGQGWQHPLGQCWCKWGYQGEQNYRGSASVTNTNTSIITNRWWWYDMQYLD